jgi:hypothetical protein
MLKFEQAQNLNPTLTINPKNANRPLKNMREQLTKEIN